MGIGKTPVNQLNALPLQDADTSAAGGQIQVVGNTFVRYFDGPTLGIASAVAQTINTKVCLVTNYLDLRGCTKFTFILRRDTAAAALALPACSLQVQTRMGQADTPSPAYVNGGLQDLPNGIFTITAGTVTFTADAVNGPPTRQTFAWAWDSGTAMGAGVGTTAVVGSDSRLIVSWSTNPVPAANLFTAQLWASG